MKITKIESFVVSSGRRNFVFVKTHTDEGIYGVGESYSVGPDDAVAAVIADFESWLIGRDPRDVEFLWQLMYNATRFPGGVVTNAAISGIEHTLWDIKGKALGVPVWQLLGGKARDKVRVYQNPGGGPPEEMAERSLEIIEKYGYTALKIGPQPPGSEKMTDSQVLKGSVARMEAVRRAVGDDVDIGVDPHAKIFEPIRAIQLAQALQPYAPYFIEEPLRPENIDAMGELRKSFSQIGVPLATGEMLYTKFEFRDLLVRNAADIVQPDICCAGGLLEQRKIAAMAEAFYVTVAPHNPMGPVATMVNVHFCVCTPNFLILEYNPDDRPDRGILVDEPATVVGGYIEAPTKPGLGIDLNVEAYTAERCFKRWHRAWPIGPDGAMRYP